MLQELKFVQGAVGKKDLIPEMTHFKIQNGRINSFNGHVALSTTIQLDLDCAPKASTFLKAVSSCDDTVALTMMKNGKLSVKAGKFKAFIDCVEDTSPHVLPEGTMLHVDGAKLLTALKTLSPFMGDDATRPWSNGILLKGPSAYATNNIILMEYWTGTDFPITCCIPRFAVREMIRINLVPVAAQCSDNSITFFYEGDKWLRTSLLSTQWPSAIEQILGEEAAPSPVEWSFFEALETLKPFSDELNRVYFTEGVMRTSLDADVGAVHDYPGLPAQGTFAIEKLLSLSPVAQLFDFSSYPKPCLFYGDNLRGAIIGLR
jgi:DNA polymerase III sliding clamp (beta) subunit (PCNA family)